MAARIRTDMNRNLSELSEFASEYGKNQKT